MTEEYSPEKRGPGRPRIIREEVTAQSLPGPNIAPSPKYTPPVAPPESPTTRAETVNRERRRRTDDGPLAGLRLHVPEEFKDPDYEYRYINDDEARIYAKTKLDDYDIVTDARIPGLTSEGTLVGKNAAGAGKRALLVRKPKDWYRADKAKELATISAREKDIRRGVVSEPGALSGNTAYVPDKLSDTAYSSDTPGRNRIE